MTNWIIRFFIVMLGLGYLNALHIGFENKWQNGGFVEVTKLSCPYDLSC